MRGNVEALRALFARVPTPYTGTGGTTGGGLFSGPGGTMGRAEQLQASASNGTVYAIVSNLAAGCSNADWHLYRKKTDGRRRLGPAPDERVEVLSHQALKVWDRPNPFMWQSAFVERIVQHLELTGLTFWAVDRTPELASFGRIPTGLWPVRPDRMTVVPSPEDFIQGWIYTGPDGERVPLDVDEVIALATPDPWDVYGGLSPLSAVAADVEAADAAAMWNRNFFRNSALPGGIIEVNASLSEPEWRKMVRRWRESHQGVSNAHRVGILENATWKDRNVSQKDMEFVQLRVSSRDVIREAWAYPSFLLGDMAEANRAGAYAAEFVEARRHLAPRLRRIRGALNNVFLPMFSTAENLEFDFDSPEPDDEEAFAALNVQRATAAAALMGIPGVKLDFDDVLEVVGLPPIKHEEATPPPALAPVPPPPDDPPADPAGPPQDPSEVDPDAEGVTALARSILAGLDHPAIMNGHSHTDRTGRARR